MGYAITIQCTSTYAHCNLGFDYAENKSGRFRDLISDTQVFRLFIYLKDERKNKVAFAAEVTI